MAETRGTRHLRQAGVAFDVHTYRHDRKGAAFASDAIGIPLERFAKTLVADAGGPVLVLMPGDRELSLRKLARVRGVKDAGGPVLVLMPGDRELSLRKLARVRGVKDAAMADPKDAERLTGYLVGGIGPFGTRRELPVLLDASFGSHERIAVNGGGRGIIVELARVDLERLTGATVADLAQEG